MPARIDISAWAEHAPFAFWLIDVLQPECLVELGVYHGFSYLAMCQAAARFNKPARCCGVDLWTGDEHAGFYGDEVFHRLKEYHDTHYAGFSQLIRKSFDDAVSEFHDGSIDLLHIDGRHFYEDVKHDFEIWQPKLSDRAVVLFHDTNVYDRQFGVWKLWRELTSRHPSFEFLHGYGLGVLGYGNDTPEPLRRLFASGQQVNVARTIGDVYHRLGAVNAERVRFELKVNELGHLNKELGLERSLEQLS